MIAILDYGSGNLRSAERAFATAGKDVVVTSDRSVALEAEGLVVPGVGAFAACMNGLNAVDGAAIVRERLAKERPTLGICIGMQIMFSEGTEHSENGAHAGIGIWQGSVSKLEAPILPHMGWNTVEASATSTLFNGLEGESFYFVHSYAAKNSVGTSQAWSTHGEKFLAAVEDGYISATQFHPEKSGAAGLALIKNWVRSL
ncbi:MAG: imidazole glycerol phosphate synthase subunit HisH [Actinobacteria bacterium]|nr:imidazole glycerol phosphate synthase subunit HisH [Actinomycetota bacterium]